MNSKKIAADKAITLVQNGMILGLGTGSTAYWAIEGIGARIKNEGLKLEAIATSKQSEKQARSLGIPILSFADIDEIDLTIDGADEVDPGKNLIKGGGGALLREKIVASNSKKLVIIVDEKKLVDCLGRFPLPVETAIFGWEKTSKKLAALGCKTVLRMDNNKPFITDNGNYIVDCHFLKIPDPPAIHERINAIIGVMENGLFIQLASQIVVGYEDGTSRLII
jgi:ribose 5-phosphate isomerase A